MGLMVKLIKSHSGASVKQLATIRGLGIWKMGSERLLKDTPAIRGMIDRVQHLVAMEVVTQEPKTRVRQKPTKIRRRDAARAAAK